MRILFDSDGEPLPGGVPIYHKLVAVNPGRAVSCRAGDACEVLAAGFRVDLIDAIGVIVGSSPEIRGGRFYDIFNVVGIFWMDLTRHAG